MAMNARSSRQNRPPLLATSSSETRAALFRGKVALLYDAFVRLSWPFDLIFQLTVPLG
jgi:hypothetical protein